MCSENRGIRIMKNNSFTLEGNNIMAIFTLVDTAELYDEPLQYEIWERGDDISILQQRREISGNLYFASSATRKLTEEEVGIKTQSILNHHKKHCKNCGPECKKLDNILQIWYKYCEENSVKTNPQEPSINVINMKGNIMEKSTVEQLQAQVAQLQAQAAQVATPVEQKSFLSHWVGVFVNFAKRNAAPVTAGVLIGGFVIPAVVTMVKNKSNEAIDGGSVL